jgi:hypothetical protein
MPLPSMSPWAVGKIGLGQRLWTGSMMNSMHDSWTVQHKGRCTELPLSPLKKIPLSLFFFHLLDIPSYNSYMHIYLCLSSNNFSQFLSIFYYLYFLWTLCFCIFFLNTYEIKLLFFLNLWFKFTN